jgi:hypothetical protein
MMLTTIDSLTAQLAQLSASIEQAIAPFQVQVDGLDEIAVIGPICAPDVIAEIGVDMGRAPPTFLQRKGQGVVRIS